MTRTDPEKDPVTAWAEDVHAGRILAGPHVRNAAERHLKDLDTACDRGFVWDVDAAKDVIGFFHRRLRLNGGDFEGKPFHLHPSQQFRVGSLFGWKNVETGLRRFRRFYDEEGKGNGKSPMLAGIGIVGLVKEREPRAEVYAAASKKDQAQILFKDAVAMVDQSPSLKSRIKQLGIDPVYSLVYRAGDGGKREFKPISKDSGQSGPRPSMALCDEVHEHRDRSTIEMLERGFKFRKQPLLCMATNSGTDRNSICYEEHTHAINVAAGLVEDDTTFAFVCSLDEDDDWENDPSCWGKPNPLLGSILTEKYLALQVDQAKKMPGKRNGIARLHFCEWTDAETAAFSRATWMGCLGEVEMASLVEAGYRCFGGLDLSRVRDFTAFTLTWVLDEARDSQVFASKTWFWTPKNTLRQRAAEDRVPYDRWVDDGHIEAVKGDRISYRWVAEALQEICAIAHPVEIGCDQYGLENLQDHLNDIGADLPMTIHPQGFQKRIIEKDDTQPEGAQEVYLWMPDSINKFENAIYEGRIRIHPNPMMNHCASSVTYAENRTGHRMFDKSKALGRIDGMVSQAMSIGVATCREKRVVEPSVYKRRGLLKV
ncbi:putative phage terminase, large subunit [Roseibium sp. TrichSKD4]|uniref:terminase large subunit n=1 Tax=Roseibium sp. TrichSKD4 TaxID=744980 RepID=UPI0001E56B12|nr:terminase large subunit [Roseibium sp. TrichSKD4]EFO32608.1 putative phage terminase, large subunit [Roseibium sp. TrichSKD4]